MEITTLFDHNYGEHRDVAENSAIPLSAALASVGFGLPTDSNEIVNERTALQVPTVLACVRVLSEGVGSLPLRVYEELERGRKIAKSHYLYHLLTLEPNPEATAVTLQTTLMTHAVLWQNAYAEIERNAAGQCIGLWPRVPWRTKAVRRNGRLFYETTDTTNQTPRLIDAGNMLHVVGFSLDALTGTSLIGLARQSVGLALAAAKFGGRFYANSARPGFVLELSAPLAPEDMTRLREDLELMSSGVNAHRIAIIPPGMSAKPLTIEPVNAQYNETRKFEREEIAATFRVPGYMVGATEKVLKSTVEAQNLEFLTYSLRPWIERFEQEFQRKLLPPISRSANRYSIHFYADAMITVDMQTRISRANIGRQGGWLSINDVRESENLPVIKGGDDYLQPLNMAIVGKQANDVETDDEPEADPSTASRAKQLYLPIFADAIHRVQHRSKHDAGTISQTMSPILSGMGAYFRSGDAGQNETTALAKYIGGLESRINKGEIAPDAEFRKALKTVVYAVAQDQAEDNARKVSSR